MNTKEIDKQHSKSKELITREDVQDSPFTIIGVDGKYFGSMGKHRITQPKETIEEVRKELQEMTWNRIVQVIMIVSESMK